MRRRLWIAGAVLPVLLAGGCDEAGEPAAVIVGEPDGTGDGQTEAAEEAVEEKALPRGELREVFREAVEASGLTVGDVDESGDMYFEGRRLVVLLEDADSAQNPKEAKKLREVMEGLMEEHESSFGLKEADYSRQELVQAQNGFFSLNADIPFSENTQLSLGSEESEILLKTDELAGRYVEALENEYGDMLRVEIDPDFVVQSVDLEEE
ncbi:hypothetical protein [Indiicoccus explosivorum]|uniref:hypothetical protein n=1 Tax=Indiicoccus explosivorum TaxID=1917864 RepID=UPI000B432C06|nr:hypothetical protein [Indiicoccus explosivorum]